MKIGKRRQHPSEPPQPDQPSSSEGSEQAPPVQAPPVPAARVQPAMLPSSPLAPFTPAVLAHVPEPVPEPRSDEPVEPDRNPMAPMAPVAVVTQGKCCGDTDGGGGGGQTPWTSDHDAAGHDLNNISNINAPNYLGITANQGLFIQGNEVYISAAGNAASMDSAYSPGPPFYGYIMSFRSGVSVRDALQVGRQILISGTNIGTGSPLNIRNLPTASAGLQSGDVWNNSGVLNIVP